MALIIVSLILLLFSTVDCNYLDEDNVYTVNYIPLDDENPHTNLKDAYYHAAVVDYFPVQNRSLSPKERLHKNVDNYIEIIRNISVNPIDIVVFPEDALQYGRRGGKLSDYAVVVGFNVTPCDSKEAGENFFVRLSCAALEYKVYLSVNLLEKEQDPHNVNTWNIYNTNVVFNRKGTVISRYRKFNLYGEPRINVTSKAEVATFTTDFGVTFGVFICFDIMNESPVSELLKLGVRHFIFPSLWFSELHFLTALQMQQMWSYKNNVVLLAAGTNYPKRASGGSGIYLGRSGPLQVHFSNVEDTKVLYHMVPKNLQTPTKRKQNLDDVHQDLKDYPFWKLPYTRMNFTTLPLKYITDNTDYNTICHDNGFCCRFDVRVSKNPEVNTTDQQYNYRAMVYSGLRSFPGNTVPPKWIDVCALIACTTNDLDSCGERYNSVKQSTIFQSLSISLKYDPIPSEDTTRRVHYPDTLTTKFVPLEVKSFTWKEAISTINLTKPSEIFAFGIFGRDYAKDVDVEV